MVIGEVAATTAPLEQSVVIGWVIGLPLWDDWQYLAQNCTKKIFTTQIIMMV